MFYLSIVPKVGMYFVLFRLYYYVFVEFTSVWKTFLLMAVAWLEAVRGLNWTTNLPREDGSFGTY